MQSTGPALLARRLLALFIALSLVAAACGGGSDGDNSAGNDTGSVSDTADTNDGDGSTVATADGSDLAESALATGDCFETGEDLAAAQGRVACEELHSYEVISVVSVADGSFPGADDINRQAEDACTAAFVAAKGVPPKVTPIEHLWAVPNEATWAEGDRSIACAVRYPRPAAVTFGELDPLRSFGIISTFGFQKGDCFEELNLSLIGAAPVPCSEPHTFEVYATTELEGDEWPGIGFVEEQQNVFCGTELALFLGGVRDDLQAKALYPDERTWAEVNDRLISCFILHPAPVTGSQAGTGDPVEDDSGTLLNSDLVGGDLADGNWISIDRMTSTEISLFWSEVDGASAYSLSRVAKADATGNDPLSWPGASVIYTGADLSVIDDTVVAGEEYVYFVEAVGPGFATNPQWRAAAAVDDTTPPLPVGNVNALRTADGVLLQWTESTDDYRFAVYEIYRGLNGEAPTYYGTVWVSTETAYIDIDPPASGSATYQVIAIDFHGNRSIPGERTLDFG